MYGLTTDVDLSFLVSKKLNQICISVYQLIMRFDDVSISVESEIKFSNTDGNTYCFENNKLVNQDFLDLIEQSVVNVEHYSNGTLILFFENGSKVELNDDSEKYESYQIMGPGKSIIV